MPQSAASLAVLGVFAIAGGGAHAQTYATPEAAVRQAADAAPAGVAVSVRFRVRAVGRSEGRVYLNSTTDYRDPRNLTVVVSDPAIGPMEARFGKAETFRDREVMVRGVAARVRVDSPPAGSRPACSITSSICP